MSDARQTALSLSHYLRARWRWENLNGKALRHWQDQRARQIVRYAWQHAPFFRQHWANYNRSDWQTLPIVEKSDMMANFSGYNTAGIDADSALALALHAEESRNFVPTIQDKHKRTYTVGLSSGTSGHRGLFLVSQTEQAGWAGIILARAVPNWRDLLRRPPLRVAFFLRANSNLYQSTHQRGIQFRYFDLMSAFAGHVAQLQEFQPQIVVAPPSMLGLLAGEQRAGRLKLQPERVISVAEVLETQDQQSLADSFQCQVAQIYQCTEGLLGVSCAHGSLHWQEDLVAAQWQPLADGRVQPILTDLWRFTQPIIRYRLNDILQLAETPCPCGNSWQVLKQIEGRKDDLCYFAEIATGDWRIFFPDVIRRMILLANTAVQDYLAVQDGRGNLRVYLALAEESAAPQAIQAVRESIARELARYHCRGGKIQVELGLPPLPVGQKRRRVQAKNVN